MARGENTGDKKSASSNAKGRPAKPTIAGVAVPPETEADDDKRAERRVALLRHKLTQAIEDPLMRDQIVRAIRTMMNGDG